MKNHRIVLVLLLDILLILLSLSANAAPAPLEILQKMDLTISGFDDQRMDVDMTVIDTNGSQKSYYYQVYQKGESRLVKMLSGEVKGMTILSMSADRVYVYLPGFKRVRRVAASNLNQAFVGSDFTQDDMATTEWAKNHDGVIINEDDGFWYLRCTPKPGEKTGYKYAELKVAKTDFRQWEVKYFNDRDQNYKVMEMSEVYKFPSGAVRHRRVTMRDVLTSHRTDLFIRDFVVNSGYKDSMFTVRQLQWGK